MSFGEKRKAREYFFPVYIPVYQEINSSFFSKLANNFGKKFSLGRLTKVCAT